MMESGALKISSMLWIVATWTIDLLWTITFHAQKYSFAEEVAKLLTKLFSIHFHQYESSPSVWMENPFTSSWSYYTLHLAGYIRVFERNLHQSKWNAFFSPAKFPIMFSLRICMYPVSPKHLRSIWCIPRFSAFTVMRLLLLNANTFGASSVYSVCIMELKFDWMRISSTDEWRGIGKLTFCACCVFPFIYSTTKSMG